VLHAVLTGVLAAGVVALFTSAHRQVLTDWAITEAETVSLATGQGFVEPVLYDGVVSSEPPAIQQLDHAVHARVLSHSLVRVKLWRRDGTIVYSDEPRLIGDRFPLTDDLRHQFAELRSHAAVSEMGSPEHRYEPDPRMLEVYTPVHAHDGTPLLLETYFRYGGVTDAGGSVAEELVVVAVVWLLLLALVELPLARWSLRCLRSVAARHEHLVSSAIRCERRRIARGLHDGVVQDLTGVALQLAAAEKAGCDPLLASAAVEVRQSIHSLRSLLVDFYPSELHAAGLDAALSVLLTELDKRGIATHLLVGVDTSSMAPATAGVLYRAAQEALRNVVKHAGAQVVRVSLTADLGDVVLVVEDDGRGFWADAWPQLAADGHMGLKSTQDLLADAGGRLNIRSFPAEGTRFTARVPQVPRPAAGDSGHTPGAGSRWRAIGPRR
jgi:two-component system NarL family sensor kinase